MNTSISNVEAANRQHASVAGRTRRMPSSGLGALGALAVLSKTLRSRWLVLVVAAGLAGCSMAPPPSIEPQMPRRGITPRSYKMKLAVFNLLDPTGSGGRLSEGLSEMLHVALFETSRFELMQRAEIRGTDPSDIKQIQERYKRELDAFVVGSITNFNTAERTMTLNVNVMNPYGTTMAAKSFTVRYTGTINVSANREDVNGIAQWIEREFAKLEDGRVIARSGDRVRINLGGDQGVQVGMWVLIASRGDMIKDPETGEFLGSDIYVGEAYVVAVDPGTCEAMVVETLRGRTPEIRVNDKVVFK